MELITTTRALDAVCTQLAAHDMVAVDTEFMRESTYWPKLCLVQAAAGDVEALIDPLAAGVDLAPLLALMADASTLKVFHAARQDVEIFFHLAGRAPAPLFDTQIAAAAVGLGDSIAYDNLVRATLNKAVDKSSRFTDWSQRPLSDKQLAYALSDVTHLRDMHPLLEARLADMKRSHWVGDEMAALGDPALYDTAPDAAWKRLKLRKTTPAYLAALKAAAAWREAEAQRRDSPRGRILKDDALYEIALQRPASTEALGRLRAVPRGFERSRHAADLIAALKPALDAPEDYAPHVEKAPPTPPGLGPTIDLLKVLLRMRAEDHDVAARLIATVGDLEKIAARDDADVAALKGWRREIFGEDALRLKRGDLSLRLEGGRVVTAEAANA